MTVPTSEDYVYLLQRESYSGLSNLLMGVFRTESAAKEAVEVFIASHLRVTNKSVSVVARWDSMGSGETLGEVPEIDANFRISQHRLQS